MAIELIHHDIYFSKEEILRRAKKYEYPNPLAVEMFLWDCELASQLQTICDDLVLKGGAAAQLHLPLERQRGSRDLDMVTFLKRDDINEIIHKLDEKLGGSVEFKLHKPKNPKVELPLRTYFANVPSKTVPELGKLGIKIDFMCEWPEFPSLVLRKVQTYAVEVESIKCSTAGALTGDKLLSLAKGSIGLELEADFPKQIYDVDALLETSELSKSFVNDFETSIRGLTSIEASFRNITTTPKEVLSDVIQTMDEYSLVDMPTGKREIKQEIEKFQQFFVSRSQRRPYYGWSTKALRIRFLASLTCRLLNGEISDREAAQVLASCVNRERCLGNIQGKSIIELRKGMLELAQKEIPHFKDLKGKPLDRVFWQILTPENLEKLSSLIPSP
jgi:hypothetical protein